MVGRIASIIGVLMIMSVFFFFGKEITLGASTMNGAPSSEIITPTIQVEPMRIFTGAKELGKKYIALTFDDGPNPKTTPGLLDTLKKYNIKGTFFVIGVNASKHRDILKRIHDEGHEIGSHSWDHRNFTKLSVQEILDDRDRMDRLIYDTTGTYPYLYRPPYGLTNSGVQMIYGRPAILWSVDPNDWKYRNTARNIRLVETTIHDNAIILFHDIYPTSVGAIGPIITTLQAQGYVFVTVSDLLSLNSMPLSGTGTCTFGNTCR